MYGATQINHIRHFDADETTAARGVGQQVFVVAGTNKRGVATKFLHAATVGRRVFTTGAWKYVLQKGLLVGGNLIELVNINQGKTVQNSSASRLRPKSMLSV